MTTSANEVPGEACVLLTLPEVTRRGARCRVQAAVVVWRGQRRLDVRWYEADAEGRWTPTVRGVAVEAHQLEAFVAAAGLAERLIGTKKGVDRADRVAKPEGTGFAPKAIE